MGNYVGLRTLCGALIIQAGARSVCSKDPGNKENGEIESKNPEIKRLRLKPCKHSAEHDEALQGKSGKDAEELCGPDAMSWEAVLWKEQDRPMRVTTAGVQQEV